MTAATSAVDTSTGAISTEKTTYRRYVKFGTVVDGDSTKTTIKEQRVAQESSAKDKETGLPRAWADAEKEGLVVFNENTATTYNVKSQEGFETLIPDPEQRLYIINAGLNNIQTAKVQAFMKANKEGAAEPTPEFNQVDLDLRVGLGDDQEYSIQIAPQRRSLSDQEKLEKTLKGLNLSPDQLQQLLLSVAASLPQSNG